MSEHPQLIDSASLTDAQRDALRFQLGTAHQLLRGLVARCGYDMAPEDAYDLNHALGHVSTALASLETTLDAETAAALPGLVTS